MWMKMTIASVLAAGMAAMPGLAQDAEMVPVVGPVGSPEQTQPAPTNPGTSATGLAYQYEGEWQAVLQEGASGRQIQVLNSCSTPVVITARGDRLLQVSRGGATSVVQVSDIDAHTNMWMNEGRTEIVTKASDGNFAQMETVERRNGGQARVISYLRCGSAGATANSQMCVAGNACAIPEPAPRVVPAPPVVRTVEDRLNQLFKLSPIEFDVNRATIRTTSRATLDEAASIIKSNPQAGNLMIIGHTDSDGSASSNLSLSQRRADAVKTYLVTQRGVNAGRLMTDGKGESQLLISPENSRADKQRNRRIEWRRMSSAPLNRSQ
jgi:outer membrane protein OmpA-like peptidoglycan-associated protein